MKTPKEIVASLSKPEGVCFDGIEKLVADIQGEAFNEGHSQGMDIVMDFYKPDRALGRQVSHTKEIGELVESCNRAIDVLTEGKTCNGKAAVAVHILRDAIGKIVFASTEQH